MIGGPELPSPTASLRAVGVTPGTRRLLPGLQRERPKATVMLQHMVQWLRQQAQTTTGPGKLARWVGRGWARLTYARRVEPHWLELNEHEVPIADLPEPFHGLRIVQLSDLHCGRHVTPTYLNEAVDLALAQHGHVVVLTGDFIHKGYKHVERVANVVSRLSSPHGV